MAKATAEVIETRVIKHVIKLELDQDEAQFIVDIFAKIGGITSTTRRKYQHSISNALYATGIYIEKTSDLCGSIECK